MDLKLTLAVALLLFGSLVLPAMAQEEEDLLIPEPVVYGPEADKIYLMTSLARRDVPEAKQPLWQCNNRILGMAGQTFHTDTVLYGVNNRDDPCRNHGEITEVGKTHNKAPGVSGSTYQIPLYPALQEGTPLREGEAFSLDAVIYIVGLSTTGVTAGLILEPLITLSVNGELLASYEGSIGTDTCGPQTTPCRIPMKFDFDQAAPATLPGGVMNLTLDFSSISTGMASAPTESELRTLHTTLHFPTNDNDLGHVVIPFAEGARDFFPGPIPDDVDDNQTDDDNNTGNQTDDDNNTGNQTGNETPTPTPTNTTVEANNTTAPQPVEKGFLPGFEVATLVSGSLVALAYLGRHRRPPLGRPPR